MEPVYSVLMLTRVINLLPLPPRMTQPRAGPSDLHLTIAMAVGGEALESHIERTLHFHHRITDLAL